MRKLHPIGQSDSSKTGKTREVDVRGRGCSEHTASHADPARSRPPTTWFSHRFSFKARMRNKQRLLFSFLKSCLPFEEVTNFSFHTLTGVKRPNRERLGVWVRGGKVRLRLDRQETHHDDSETKLSWQHLKVLTKLERLPCSRGSV